LEQQYQRQQQEKQTKINKKNYNRNKAIDLLRRWHDLSIGTSRQRVPFALEQQEKSE